MLSVDLTELSKRYCLDGLAKQNELYSKSKLIFGQDVMPDQLTIFTTEASSSHAMMYQSSSLRKSGARICLPTGYVPRDADILCGRGKAYSKHRGNQIFTEVIRHSLKAYTEASTRIDRSAIVKSVVEYLFESGMKFLKMNSNGENFVELSFEQAHGKVGHAIRDLLKKGGNTTMTKSQGEDKIMDTQRDANAGKAASPAVIYNGKSGSAAQGTTHGGTKVEGVATSSANCVPIQVNADDTSEEVANANGRMRDYSAASVQMTHALFSFSDLDLGSISDDQELESGKTLYDFTNRKEDDRDFFDRITTDLFSDNRIDGKLDNQGWCSPLSLDSGSDSAIEWP